MALNIKKGKKANLPSTKQEDTLYICKEGNLFYDYSNNERIEIGNEENNNNNIILDNSFVKVNGIGNICGSSTFTNGSNSRIFDQLPISNIKITPTYNGPEGSQEYYDYTDSNVLTITYTDSYEYSGSSPQDPEEWTVFKRKYDLLGDIPKGTVGRISHQDVDYLPNILHAIVLNVGDEYCGLFNIINREFYIDYHSQYGTINNPTLFYGFDLVPFGTGIYSLSYINSYFPNIFDAIKGNKSYQDKTQIIQQLNVKDNYQVFARHGRQINSASNSIVNGVLNVNTTSNSLLSGWELRNRTPNATVLGKYNNYNSNYMFSIGNGNGTNNRKNIFGITTTGKVNATGAFSSNGADYAEYFEWKTIPVEKDTHGLLVTLDKNKIRLANKNDKYILGIISAAPGVIGNTQDEEWQGKYEINIFGAKKLDAEGNEILSPDYDEKQKYIPRSERAEWALVGLLGQIVAVDDGTCVEGGFCSAGENGIATAADQGYYVMERLDDNHIKVCVK